MTFTILLFISVVCFPFNNGNALNLKRKHVKPRKIEHEQILYDFFLKKKTKKISKTSLLSLLLNNLNQPKTKFLLIFTGRNKKSKSRATCLRKNARKIYLPSLRSAFIFCILWKGGIRFFKRMPIGRSA